MPYGPGLKSGPRKGRRVKAEKRPGGPAGPYPGESSNPAVRARARRERAKARKQGETPVVPYRPKEGAGAKRAAAYAREDKARTKRRKAKRRTKRLERKAVSTFRRGLREIREAEEPVRRRGYKAPQLKAAARTGEGLSRDEQLEQVVDLQVIEPAKRAKVLPKEKSTGQKIAEGVAEVGIALAPGGGALKGARTAGTLAREARTVERIAARAPKGGIKAAPRVGRVKRAKAGLKAKGERNLASHRRGQAVNRARRRIQPKARSRYKVRAKRKGRDVRLRYGREGRKVARRQRATKVGLLSPYATATGGGVAGLGVLGAAIEGHVEAIKNKPGQVAVRTLEIAPGLVISTGDLAAQTAQAIGTGNSAGLRKRISEDVDFAKELAATMASGDKERVQRYVEENGLIAPLTLGPPLLRLGRKPVGRVARDLAPERVTQRAKRRGKRKQLSRDAARGQAEASMDIDAEVGPVVRAYSGRRGRKGVKGRRKAREKPVDRGDVVALAAEEGLTPASAAANFDRVAAKWGNRPVFGDKREGGVTGHDLMAYVRSDPGIWKDPAFWRTVEAYRAQEPAVRLSEDVIDVEQAKTHGVQLYEDRPPPAARPLVPSARTREDVAGFISKSGDGGKRVRRLRETIRAAEGKARELRAEARQAGKRGDRYGPDVAMRRRQQLLDAEADIRGMRAELAGTRKRHRTIAQSLRDSAQTALAKQEFDAELAAVREDRGLVRGAYVPHVDVGKEGIPVAQPISYGGKKIHRRRRDEGSLAEQGRVDYSLRTIVQAGGEAPRLRRAVHEFVNRAVHEGAIPIIGRHGKRKRVATREEFERALTPEQKANTRLWPLNQFNQAVKQGDVDAMNDLVARLGEEIEAAKGTPKTKYIALDNDYALELKAQISAPGSALERANLLSRGVARFILASPAWAMAQIVAESLQAAHAINPLNPANIYHMVQGRRGLRRMSPEKQREFRANSGGRPPGVGAVSREYMTVDGRGHGALAARFKRMERIFPINRLIQAVRLDWINYIDRVKGGGIQATVAATKAHKDAMGFGKRLQRLVKGQQELSRKLAKMTPEQRLEWSIRDTPAKRALENYNSDVLGNWRAFSRKEKLWAPAIIFYPFLRMSMEWPFYAFPKRHPVRASIMYELAASHNAQLRELLGGPPSWLSNFGKALIYGNKPGEVKVISATRIIPGANAVFEAISGGFDVAAQRGLNPVVGYFNALVNGIDPLSGEKVDEHKSAEEAFIARMGLVTSLLFNTPPPLRAIDQLRGSKEAIAFPIIGPRRKKDALGEVIEELSGTPGERAVRTLLNPFPSQDLEQARDSAALERIFEIWRTSGSDAQDAVINNDSLSKAEKKKRLKVMRARSDEADAELKRLYRKYAAPGWEAKDKKSSEEYFDLKYPDEEGKSDNQFGIPSTDSEELREQFGLPDTSPSALRKQFGIE